MFFYHNMKCTVEFFAVLWGDFVIISNNNSSRMNEFISVLRCRPCASASIDGSDEYPNVKGLVRFYQTKCGVLVCAEVFGLPACENQCEKRIFAFHIHSGSCCKGDMEDPFANAMTHYNPDDCEHPCHAGDLPPLFGNNGYAFSIFLTDRFSVKEIIGRTVIIHSNPDDFITQPSGNSGEKIACGEIKKFNRFK